MQIFIASCAILMAMQPLHDWFKENRRSFPWRENPTPYRVWVSEVMLQQTRSSVVIPYFLRWMELFPDIQTLAFAPLEAVMKAWEGLGYYSRVRNLHQAAKQVVEKFGGDLPQSREELSDLKGLGAYTIGAILSFAFHKRAAAVDGNVVRVLSRYFCIEENVSRLSVRKKIEQTAQTLLDPNEPWVTAEALIELGATVCTANPRCVDCPIQTSCLAYQTAKAPYLPIKDAAVKPTSLHRIVAVIVAQGSVLVRKQDPGKIMADLYEFPYFEKGEKLPWGLKLKDAIALPEVSHTFTRYKAHLYPRLFCWEEKLTTPGYVWVEKQSLNQLPFSSGHRKIVHLCKSYI